MVPAAADPVIFISLNTSTKESVVFLFIIDRIVVDNIMGVSSKIVKSDLFIPV